MSLPLKEIAVSILFLLLVLVFIPNAFGVNSIKKLSTEMTPEELLALKLELSVFVGSSQEQIDAAFNDYNEKLLNERMQANLFFKFGVWAVLILFYFLVVPGLFVEPSKEKYVQATKKIFSKGFKEKIVFQMHSQYGFSVAGFKVSFDLLDDWRNAVVRLNKFVVDKESIQHKIELLSFVDVEKETVLCFPKTFPEHQLETGKKNLLDISRVYSKPIGFDYKLLEKFDEKLKNLEVK